MRDETKHWVDLQIVKVLRNSIEYTARVLVYWYNDPAYGADADGNRSISKDFIDHIEIEDICDVDGNYIDSTPKELEALIYDTIN